MDGVMVHVAGGLRVPAVRTAETPDLLSADGELTQCCPTDPASGSGAVSSSRDWRHLEAACQAILSYQSLGLPSSSHPCYHRSHRNSRGSARDRCRTFWCLKGRLAGGGPMQVPRSTMAVPRRSGVVLANFQTNTLRANFGSNRQPSSLLRRPESPAVLRAWDTRPTLGLSLPQDLATSGSDRFSKPTRSPRLFHLALKPPTPLSQPFVPSHGPRPQPTAFLCIPRFLETGTHFSHESVLQPRLPVGVSS